MKNKLEQTFVVGAISFMLLFAIGAVIQPAKANPQFVLGGIGYPLPNGNGIDNIAAYVDSVFNATMYFNPDIDFDPLIATNPLEVEVGVNITLAVFCWINGTETGIASLSEGLDIMRHNVSVMLSNGTSIFSQQNFTYITGGDFAPMYYYRHDVILNFLPMAGMIYTVTITYEVFY